MIEVDPEVERTMRAAHDKVELLPQERLDASYALFRQHFGPDKLADIDGEALLELMHGRPNRHSLVYWLEFKSDDDFSTRRFGGIAGGSSHKFGLFFHQETKKWLKGSPKNETTISLNEAVELARKQRDQLLTAVPLIEALSPDGDEGEYLKLQQQMEKSAPELFGRAWAHKYLSLLFPTKLDDYHNEDLQRFHLIKLLQLPPKQQGLFVCASQFVRLAQHFNWPMNHLTSTLNARNGQQVRYWRVGTRMGDEKISYWDQMRDGHYVAIGFEKLGDVSNLEAEDGLKGAIRKELAAVYDMNEALLSRKAGEVSNFVEGMKKGDIVLAADGQAILGVGKIAGDYQYAETRLFHRRPVEWLQLGEWSLPQSQEGLQTTVFPIQKFPENLLEIERRVLYAGQQLPQSEPKNVELDRNYWIEKTLVKGRTDREDGPHRLGAALWSPQRSKDGKDIYSNMRQVAAGDVVFHFTDNEAITAVSIAAKKADETFAGVPGTSWGAQPSYRVQLKDLVKLEPPLSRDALFNDPEIREGLAELLKQFSSESLFYNQNLALNQGAYLTKAPRPLLDLMNQAYKKTAGRFLPYTTEPAAASVGKTAGPSMQPRYSIHDFAQETGISVSTVQMWQNRLERKKQMVLQGPPGTGKTFIAERMARLLVSETQGLSELVQFHPSYSYEDFMLGIRPDVVSGSLTYRIEKGRFLDFCDRAEKAKAPSVLIIDEMNRANLSRVFGELMYLLEYRAMEIPLSIDGSKFKIPSNVRVIGTMNTADRSIALVDHALRRRFSFVHLGPDYDVLQARLKQDALPDAGLVKALKAINVAIDDRNYEVGISFFMQDGHGLKEKLCDIWQGEIEPYLEEYFYDQPERVAPFRWASLIKGDLVDWT